jgi:hypothetical protein
MAKRYLVLPGIIVVLVSTALYWFNQNPVGVTMIDPARPPASILEPVEVEKIPYPVKTSSKGFYSRKPAHPSVCNNW